MKKQIEKLLEQLLASPNDVRLVQKAAELYQKDGDSQRAAHYFGTVAQLYAADGFLLKAVAVGKQAIKLDPMNVDAIAQVAKWLELLGLAPEAAELRLKLPGG